MIKIVVLAFLTSALQVEAQEWTIKSQEDWANARESDQNIQIENGQASSTQVMSNFTSIVKPFTKKQKAKSITFNQTTEWNNWHEIDKVTLPEMLDAPVLIPVKEHDYWLLARRYNTNPDKLQETRQSHTDEELGYHAWHSTDMKSWKHYGPVSGYIERWVTTAEYKDGKFYIYYDNPNDADPHLIIDDNLKDGKMGENIGMVFNDPTHGSDCAILRDEDGSFHLIYENWDYNNARKHSWDSPVAGHAISPDGIRDFKALGFAVDERTKSTGKYATFLHPYLAENYTTMHYEVYEPEQEAFGDWTAIKIGAQYYLFCDYEPVGEQIRIGKFTSDRLDSQFSFCGSLGMGHPDPTIGFAEGQFYLLQQKGDVDFVSPGPWVPGVEARVGVDTNGDGKINHWTHWQEIKETYALKSGFARVVDTSPAFLDLSTLPKGYGFCFMYRTNSVKGQQVLVTMKSVNVAFE